MKIGILGGSFDPPHNGHLYVANQMLKNKSITFFPRSIELTWKKNDMNPQGLPRGFEKVLDKQCDKVILMPVFRHPFAKPLTDSRHRLAMTKLIEEKSVEVSDLEIKRKGISYTIDTLNVLKTQSPQDDFFWIIGKDQIKDFGQWKGFREIKEKFGLLIAPRHPHLRGGVAPAAHLGGESEIKPLDISSSEIRKRIKLGLEINSLVPERIRRYIIKHKLYLNV